MSQMIVNEVDYRRTQRAREALVFGGALDAKRPMAWDVYGYPQEVTFEHLLAAYERGGAASGAVHRLLDGCWQQLPRIKAPEADEETTWEKAVAAKLKKVRAWAKLRDLDRRNMVGRFAAVIYRMRDSKKLYEPLDKASELVDLIPVYESQIRVETWNTDEYSEDYGKPTMFSIETAPPTERDTQARPRTWLKVHPSRVQLLAEGAVGDNFFDGVPLLKAGFNSLVDLEKVGGGGAEGFLKNSGRTIVFEFDKDADPETYDAQTGERVNVRKVLSEQARELNRNQDAAIVTQGGKANTLQTALGDPLKPFEVAACMFAASVRIPFVVLFGQQTGRLASDQDRVEMASRCSSRQQNVLTPMIEEFVKRMQACGVIEAGDFEVEWPPVNAPSEKDRLELLTRYTAALEQAFRAGIPPLFDADELRRVVGFEPQEDPPVIEGGDPAEDA